MVQVGMGRHCTRQTLPTPRSVLVTHQVLRRASVSSGLEDNAARCHPNVYVKTSSLSWSPMSSITHAKSMDDDDDDDDDDYNDGDAWSRREYLALALLAGRCR